MPDPLDSALIQRIAGLARLGLSEDEAARLATDVGAILAHFEALAEVDLEGAPEWHGVLENEGTPGADEPAPWERPRETLLPLTEHAREGFFVVPAILDRPGTDDAAPPEAAPADADDPMLLDDPAADEDVF